MPDEKRMRLRYAGVCRVCGVALPAKTEAIYERSTQDRALRRATTSGSRRAHVESPIDAGTPGARRVASSNAARQAGSNASATKHPRLGGLIHALSDEPQSTKAWDTGALGEERLGNRLNELASDTLRVLHDRRIPGSRANIDHLAVTPPVSIVIDAKKYAGRPHLKIEGGLLRPRVEKLARRHPRLHETRRRGAQTGRHRARRDRRPGPGPRGALFRRGGLAAARRLLHHPRRRGAVAQEAVRDVAGRRASRRRDARGCLPRLATALPPA